MTATPLTLSPPTGRLAVLAATAIILALPSTGLRGQSTGREGNWQGSVGILGGSIASYYGSDARRTSGAPLIGVVYRNRLVITSATNSTLGAGVHWLVSNGSFRSALGVSASESRPEDRADALAGMTDRSASAFGTATFSVRAGLATVTATTMVGLNAGAGNMQSLGLQLGGPIAARLSASIGTVATFGDRKNMAFDFGITDEQAARREALIGAGDRRLRDGDARRFTPAGGFKEMRNTAQVAYAIHGSWQVVAVVSEGRLASSVARSPLARKRSAATGAGGLAYRF